MSERPRLYLINGRLPQEERSIYRLRERQAAAPAAEPWPRNGEWRSLIHRLMRNIAKGE